MHNGLFDLVGKTAFITGAAGGIGSEIARTFAQCGASLMLADRDLEHMHDLASELRSAGHKVNAVALQVQHPGQCGDAVQEALDSYGGVDILVNSAGVNTRMRPEAYTESIWDEIIDINLKGTFNMCQAAHASLAVKGGKIVNIGSILSLVSNAMTAPYSASKGGVLQLTKSLACAWAENGINVNVILPGWIDTALSRQARVDIAGHAERVVQTTPMKRWGTPQDIVGAAVFLASPASDFMTGASLVVDGGVTAHA
ncbi:2-deoxy-D-gluconate 3-dehydrogenase [Pollutimonas subterranea]|uniref:2-deoxy-D-gluconate 3-dehydrogenase n=1 Tax=Pollutimonas subterranea TaxID=2045210 RepID=A0A2N4U6I1_9BURK|nr:SDR family NAD(P)-dependent oxidoreductase [Pollutimonas subterranea]PLC50626.1 2-deoxy-D-gluconate 3-dehydrogenase [Pollutimonas subterranea]